MKKLIKKVIRLIVMLCLKRDNNYYEIAARSLGVDPSKMTHGEVAVFYASLKQIEADMLIEFAFSDVITPFSDIDVSKIIQAGKNQKQSK